MSSSLRLLCLLVCGFGSLMAQQNEPPAEVDLGPERQIMTAAEAIGEIFHHEYTITSDTLSLSDSQASALLNDLHRPLYDSVYVVRRIFHNSTFAGYAVVTDQYGKYRPITMLVGVNPDFTVRGVRILVYRENRGGEVRRKRFLYQYRGKSSGDPIRINRDIINVSGATISVRGVNAGVRKVLHLLEMVYQENS